MQRWVTTILKLKDGRILHVRKSATAELALMEFYGVLNLSSVPGGIRKSSSISSLRNWRLLVPLWYSGFSTAQGLSSGNTCAGASGRRRSPSKVSAA
jgi:hypothetical protein